MTYQDWVDQIGMDKARRVLGFPDSTLRMWYHFSRFPRPKQLVLIIDRSAGKVDAEEWARAFVAAQEAVTC